MIKARGKMPGYSKDNLIIIAISVAIILSLTVGYSILTKQLNINTRVSLRADKDIRITALSNYTSLNGAYEIYGALYTEDSITTNISLPELNSRISYNATITNKGTASMEIKSISTSVFNNSNATYTIVGLEQGDILTTDQSVTFTVTIKYLSTTTVLPTNTNVGAVIDFEFQEFVPVQDYIVAGKILDLRGYEAPTSGVWEDSRNNKSMTLTNVTYDTVQKSYDFSGAGSFATLGSPIIPETGDFTLEAFVRTPSSVVSNTDQAIVSQVSDTTNDSGRFKLNWKATGTVPALLTFVNSQSSGNLSPIFTGNAQISSDYIMQLVRTGDQLKLYLDGVLTDTKTYNTTNTISQGPFKLGKWNSGSLQKYAGEIYAVRLYNRALSIDELINNQEVDLVKYLSATVEEPLKQYVLTNHLVTSGDGLYNTDTNEYKYKGLAPTNYIRFSGDSDIYRILSFNSDNTIKLFNISESTRSAFDASGHRTYNTTTSTYCTSALTEVVAGTGEYCGCNYYATNSNYNGLTIPIESNAKEQVDIWYSELDQSVKNYVVNHVFNVGLIQEGVSYSAAVQNAQSITITSNAGLLDAIDVVDAYPTTPSRLLSLTGTNNYIVKSAINTTGFWTMNGASDNTYDVWAVTYGTQFSKKRASRTYQTSNGVDAYFQIKPVIFIYDDVIVKGSGTNNNPFVIRRRGN